MRERQIRKWKPTCRSPKSQHRPRAHRHIRRRRQRFSHADLSRCGLNDGPDGPGPVGVEQVSRTVNLGVVVVGRAGAAEAAAAVEDGRVGEEQADGVVVAGDGDGGEEGEGGRDGVPEFGLQLAAVVGEGDAEGLAAGDEDGAVGEDDGGGEDARVGHWGQGLDGHIGQWGVDGDEVGICGRVGALLLSL